jgi:hypothetical protein
MTQDNLGNALRTLGERESGTARLEEAVPAHRAALKERRRDRVPLFAGAAVALVLLDIDEAQKVKSRWRLSRGTGSSNPSPSSGESANHRFLSGGHSPIKPVFEEAPAHRDGGVRDSLEEPERRAKAGGSD